MGEDEDGELGPGDVPWIRDEFDGLREQLGRCSGDDPELPRLCAEAADLGYVLWVLADAAGEATDPDVVEKLFGRAFENPGAGSLWEVWRVRYAHVLNVRYERDPARADLLDRVEALAAEGTESLGTWLALGARAEEAEADRGVAAAVVATGRLILARVSRIRCQAYDPGDPHHAHAGHGPWSTPPPALLAEAVHRHRAALDGHEPESWAGVDLRVGLGYLRLAEALTQEPGRETASLAAESAAHYAAVLALDTPYADLPMLHAGRGTALLWLGRLRTDRSAVREAVREFERSLDGVREAVPAEGPEPPWRQAAEFRAGFARGLLCLPHEEFARVTGVGSGAAALTVRSFVLPGVRERMAPQVLALIGRLLHESALGRGDREERFRALGLLQEAVRRWRPEEHGSPREAVRFAVLHHHGYAESGDPRWVTSMAEAAALALTDGSLPQTLAVFARSLLGRAGDLAAEHGRPAPAGAVPPDPDELIVLIAQISQSERDGAPPVFAPGNGQLPVELLREFGRGGRADWWESVFRRWEALPEGGRKRSWAAVLSLGNRLLNDPPVEHVTRDQWRVLVGAVLRSDIGHPALAAYAQALERAFEMVQLSEYAPTETVSSTASPLDQAIETLGRDLEAMAGGPGDPSDPYGSLMAGEREALEHLRLTAIAHRGLIRGTVDDAETGLRGWEQLRGGGGSPAGRMDAAVGVMLMGGEVRRGWFREDLDAVDRALARLAGHYTTLGEDPAVRIWFWPALEMSWMFRDDLASRLGRPTVPPVFDRPSPGELRRRTASLSAGDRARVLGECGAARCLQALKRGDLLAFREALPLVEEAERLSPEGSDSWLQLMGLLGSGTAILSRKDPSPRRRSAGHSDAIALLEDAIRHLGGPTHRMWVPMVLCLALAYRSRGDSRRDDLGTGRRLGREALRGLAWSALLQSGTEHTTEAVRQAVEMGFQVVRWCLTDRMPEDMLYALDACRGLALHAAAVARSVPESLTAAGQGALAEEWRRYQEANEGVPSELRRRALATLFAGEPVTGRRAGALLDPPTPAEIGTALRALGQDALVYLVGGAGNGEGAALVVTSRGKTYLVPLPELRENAPELRHPLPYEGGPGRDLGPVPGGVAGGPGDPPVPARERLERLCSWAWSAAVHPLLGLFSGAGRAGRVPRLVLAPMGRLSLVPWHAAWAPGGPGSPPGARRYALGEVEISYTASARLLCDVAARPPVPVTEAALVVGDPTGDLPYAGAEADAVQRLLYPAGRFLGRRAEGSADGPGTPEEVLGWLRGEADPGGTLHLACHGTVIENRRHSARLALHGGDLAAEELAGAAGDRLGLVVLAACRTHVSGLGHNEAFSLATAFLVAGARSVVGSLWPVPDESTSLLMFMTHHFLRAESEAPARALRRAQLWMLDPDRVSPSSLPAALAARAASIDPGDVGAWAGFTHLGW
ncbi:CHAT domain-containing protein [Streptomyces uncialis]|uniref:CHAT domain-containing protein n=1 Tax=Streptomyces uncialis TaxID=1048205 RepID=UPI00378A465A